ncbi:metallophosphoesterase [bacterium]|jgi:predicted phosphodiesterase|nr:metallophosphoesterase [bacterium]
MKLLVIPDVHGITTWKEQVDLALNDNYTHIVFLGDYVDSFTIQPNNIYNNLYDIIKIKKLYPDKITLLLGNHDYAYILDKPTTGFNHYIKYDYTRLFNMNWDLFDLAWGYEHNNKYTLLTHAGLTNDFYNDMIKDILNPNSIMHKILVTDVKESWESLPLHELLNYFKNRQDLLWRIGYKRGGSFLIGSIIWADKDELLYDNYKGIDQIVGHTQDYNVEINYIENDILYFTDVHTEDNLVGFSITI